MDLQTAAPLLCAGVTTYSAQLADNVSRGTKVGVAGIGGLGHLAIKIAAARGAEVVAFTTSPSKVDDARRFGAKDVVVVSDAKSLSSIAARWMWSCQRSRQHTIALLTSVQ
ncbi:zinc-binding dehydrogenase [Tunturiibacter psychrotolerans]|uniref:zinc-binding dehydrogenase n=1 Tax=Tunturiibacter psychrotolerans TaxID=3069686 RepID=UPI003D1F6FB6